MAAIIGGKEDEKPVSHELCKIVITLSLSFFWDQTKRK